MKTTHKNSEEIKKLLIQLEKNGVLWTDIKRACAKLSKKLPTKRADNTDLLKALSYYVSESLKLNGYSDNRESVSNPVLYAIACCDYGVFEHISQSPYRKEALLSSRVLKSASNVPHTDYFFNAVVGCLIDEKEQADKNNEIIFAAYEDMCQKTFPIGINPYWNRACTLIEMMPDSLNFRSKEGQTMLSVAIKYDLYELAAHLVRDKKHNPLFLTDNECMTVYGFVYRNYLYEQDTIKKETLHSFVNLMDKYVPEYEQYRIRENEEKLHRRYMMFQKFQWIKAILVVGVTFGAIGYIMNETMNKAEQPVQSTPANEPVLISQNRINYHDSKVREIE